MAEATAIEWCDSTFNPWIGCTKVSPACDHCYAEALMDTRWHKVRWGRGQQRQRTSAANWAQPMAWQRGAAAFMAKHGRRRRVFCASLADVFDNEVSPIWRAELFDLIKRTPDLDWLLLTKRIGNAWKLMADACGVSQASLLLPLHNVWLGASVVNQAEADRDVPKLLRVPAAVRFLSIEPILSDIRLGSWLQRSPSAAFVAGRVTPSMPDWTRIGSTAIDWVICGGESGPKARPMHPDWPRSLREQCAAAGVPFLFKQWGEFTAGEPVAEKCSEHDQSAWRRDQRGQAWHDPSEAGKPLDQLAPVKFIKVGKKAAGRLLDGRTHDGFPAP